MIVNVVKRNHDKNTDEIALYISINDSKIANLLQIDFHNGVVVVSYMPDHFIGLPDSQEDINSLLKKFHGKY